ncbi:MAG: tetratricopeptide repeat protein [Candidatus Dadabacteria bacterium]|nr:tetratricopeptide repeat protein [Candidatus Dadabacteria bacterium]MYA48674.1 tetratricopeptide repeat protein [Candidatus Dadabacteria bacterium]MYF47550.1 tetratricopeptide repeat protein [Candidatus Dadabacteria bacterium]MYG83331.1 tetratricopeptide repeat protein [Candidatus Dadabacteria bacterium]MYK48697.1 tetratricopeptide repeat protein [Candidatus Dadabacteria bacterium]
MKKFPEKKLFLLFFLFFCLSCAGAGLSIDSQRSLESGDQTTAYYYFALSMFFLEEGDLPRAVENLEKAEQIDPRSSEIKYRLGLVYMVLNMREKAVAKFTQSIVLDPSNSPAYRDLARIYLASPDEAMKRRGKKFLLKAAEIDPVDKETYLLLCASELYSGNLEEAEQYAEKSLSISPTDVMGHFYLGSIAVRRDDLDAAVKHYKRALEIQRTYYPAFVGLVETLEKAKRIEEAIAQYESAIRKFSPFRDVFISYGNMLYRHRMFKQAIEQYRSAEAADPDNPEIKFRTGLLYLESGSYEEAIGKLGEVLKRLPAHFEAKYYSAVANTKLERYSQSRKLLDSIPHSSSLYVDAVVHGAYIHELEGSAQKAVEILEGLYEKDPYNAKAVNSLGELYGRQGRQEDSISLYGRYLEKHPDDESVLYALAVSYYYGDRIPEALLVMEDIMSRNPDNFDAMNFIGYTYAERGEKLDYAEELINRALELAPGRGYIIDSLGWVYYQRGDFAKALEYLLRASEIPPPDPTILEHVGDAYEKLGKRELAQENYTKALELLNSQKLFTTEDKKIRTRLKEKLRGFGRDEA